MSRVISFRDLRLAPGLQHFNEIQLLSLGKDDLMNWHLEKLGFDLNKGILYEPSKHRDLQGRVAVGFRAVGEINPYSEYMKTRLCPMIERLAAAAIVDVSLAKEMAAMLGTAPDLVLGGSNASSEDIGEYPDEWIEEDYEDVSAQLRMLENLRDDIRGSYMNDYGNVKTPAEYKNAA